MLNAPEAGPAVRTYGFSGALCPPQAGAVLTLAVCWSTTIAPDAKVATVLKAESPWASCGVALHGEDLYVLEHTNPNSEAHEDWPPRVRKAGRNGKATTLAIFGPERQ